MANDIQFALNYGHYHELLTPEGNYRIGAGISSIDVNGNETTDQSNYYDGGGLTSTDVTGGQLVLSVSGHRKYGDPAQDHVASLALAFGQARKAGYRWTAPDGTIIEHDDVTIVNIKGAGGDPNAKGEFGFEAHFNGNPTLTQGDANTFPDIISGTNALNVSVGHKSQLSVSAMPSGGGAGRKASPALAYVSEDDDIATVSSDGWVTGVSAGMTRVLAFSVVKPSVKAYCNVTVAVG
jgi:hypothetical protein